MPEKPGRPTDDPKPHNTRVRMSDGDLKKLEHCCKVYGLTKAEVIRRGIDELYEKAQQQKE